MLHHKTVHLHPTRWCNLSCRHCYSNSGPQVRGHLSLSVILRLLAYLKEEGYSVLSISGGEPLLYPHLDAAIAIANKLGLRVNMVSNGMLVSERRLALWKNAVHLIGMSFDGIPSRHDHMRRQTGAFKRSMSKLEYLRRVEIPFSISHCVTSESMEDIPWLFEFSQAQGATALQLHPLCSSGRASTIASDMSLSQADLARLYLLARLLQSSTTELGIQLDLATVDTCHAAFEARARELVANGAAERPLSELINPLVIDEYGRLWPFIYGIQKRLLMANGDNELWRTELSSWKQAGMEKLECYISSAVSRLRASGADFVPGYDFLAAGSVEAENKKTLLPTIKL